MDILDDIVVYKLSVKKGFDE